LLLVNEKIMTGIPEKKTAIFTRYYDKPLFYFAIHRSISVYD